MIEQTDSRGQFTYRLDLDDARVVQRKRNQSGARWQDYRTYGDRHTAKAALLRLGKMAAASAHTGDAQHGD